MGDYRPVKYFPMGFFKDADEPVICGDFIVFVQNIYNGTRIVIYNIVSGKMETVVMENKLCFNLHSENNCIAFEFAGIRHGIGVIFLDTLETFEYTNAEQDILFGGIWNKCLIYRDAHNIFLLHMENKSKDALAYCHNVLGPPAVGYGTCAWLQLYKEKSCIIFYDILKNKILVLSSPGFINRICAVGRYIVYQSCFNNKCVIYKYDIGNGRLESIFEKSGWIELYEGKDDKII
ncbi:MAG TPA: hypothetical protein DD426_03100, partial [Clostridiaceae bacterium]|nr:hypothetical protein [Clostridiaceae bacterium]